MSLSRDAKKIIQYFQDDNYIGVLPMESAKDLRVVVGKQSTYNLVHLYCRLSDNNTMAQLRYKALASGVLMALTAWVCEQLEGKCLAQIPTITAQTLIETFALTEKNYQQAFLLEEALLQLQQQGNRVLTQNKEEAL